jgi:predicted ATP-dependent endonuclease of OLD family
MSENNTYIKNITIEGYKSIQKASVNLNKDLNILIGPNGAGKSNFLEFLNITGFNLINRLRFLKKSRIKNANYFIIYRKEFEKEIQELKFIVKPISSSKSENINDLASLYLKIIFSTNEIITDSYELDTTKEEEFQVLFSSIRKKLTGFQNYLGFIEYDFNYDDVFLQKPVSFLYDKKSDNINVSYGETHISMTFLNNLIYVLEFSIENNIQNFFNDEKDRFMEQISKMFNDYIEYDFKNDLFKYSPIKDIRFNNSINVIDNEDNIIISNLMLEFKIGEDWIPWEWLSDGTKRLFYIISEISFLERGTYLIEEPELGIHPHQLHKLMEYIKEQSQEKQIIVSTHSPLVLNCLKPEELNRIILTQMSENGSTFRNLNEEEAKKAKRYIKEVGFLSDYWVHSTLEDIDE